MVSERYPHYCENTSNDYFTGNTFDMTLFNPGRRWSGPIPHEKPSLAVHNEGMHRRCSVQGDASQYFPSSGANLNLLSSQQRFHCIQKPPLRNVISAPQSIDVDSNRLLPRPPVVQRSDMVMQSVSLESVDSTTAVETARYKTELCRPFEETGHCRYGGKCQFAHGISEMRFLNRHPKYKTERCRTFHQTGFCSYGQRCNFIHNDEERRGPAQSATSPVISSRQRASISMVLPLNTLGSSGNDSLSSSITSGSPSQSPSYLQEETFARLSPAPSFGSDAASQASTIYTPPGSPKHDFLDFHLMSQFDLGLSLTQLKLSV